MTTLDTLNWGYLIAGGLSAFGAGWMFGRGWKMVRQFFDSF